MDILFGISITQSVWLLVSDSACPPMHFASCTSVASPEAVLFLNSISALHSHHTFERTLLCLTHKKVYKKRKVRIL